MITTKIISYSEWSMDTGMTDPASITALARVMSATAGLIASNGDATAVNVAASMGANAAQINALAHGQSVTVTNNIKNCAGDTQCINNAVNNAILLSNSQGNSITQSSAQSAIAVLGSLLTDPTITLSPANQLAIANLTNKNASDYYVAPSNVPSGSSPNTNQSDPSWSYLGANSSGVPGNVTLDNRTVSQIDQAGKNLVGAITLAPVVVAAATLAPEAAIASSSINVAVQAITGQNFNPAETMASTIFSPLGAIATETQAAQALIAQGGKTAIATYAGIGAAANVGAYTTTNLLTGQGVSTSGMGVAVIAGGGGGLIPNPLLQAITTESLSGAAPAVFSLIQKSISPGSK